MMAWQVQPVQVPEPPRDDALGLGLTHQPKWEDVRTDRSFMERSRRRKPGALRAQETYLRRDLSCGFSGCPACRVAGAASTSPGLPLMRRERAEVVVPDAVALLQCMELLEEPLFACAAPQLLVLESVVLAALRIAPSRDASRLRNFFRDDRRQATDCRVFWFPDQHHAATAVVPALSSASGSELVTLESMEARDRRAIAQTLRWYADQGHLASSTSILFMTRDVDESPSLEIVATVQNATAMTCETFLRERLQDANRDSVEFLAELATNTAEAVDWWLEQRYGDGENDGSVAVLSEFAPHLPIQRIRDLAETGQVVTGKLEVSQHNPMEAFVVADGGSSTGIDKVFVFGRESMNRGVHGDIVAVEMLPRTQWQAPQSDRLLVHYTADDGGADGDGDKEGEVRHEHSSRSPDLDAEPMNSIPTGRIVGVLTRSPRFHVATILADTVRESDDMALAIPMDLRLPKIRIRSQRMDALVDKRLKVVIDHWPIDSQYPQGHYVGVIGSHGNLSTELSALLVQNDIEEAPFSEGALACLPECDIEKYNIAECSTSKRPMFCPLLDWQVPLDEVSRRRDLRDSHRVFSVDPPGCQDIDDAMSIRELPNGRLELGVHIADVSHFVQHESRLDYEARSRATTVYLVGQRLDMLPSVLSADLCSLHERVDRLAVSVLWELDASTFEICNGGKPTWFGRSIIRSCSSMTYEQAHRLLQGLNADNTRDDRVTKQRQVGVAGGPIPIPLQQDLRHDLSLLTDIARELSRTRGEHGGLDLSKHEELKFSLNVTELGEEGVELMVKESLEIHSTIAELMILANGCVARQIVDTFPTHALVRRHPPPSGDRFTQLIKIARARNLDIDAANNYTLQQSLVAAERSGQVDSKTMALLKSLAVRVMTEAEYVCTSAVVAPGADVGSGVAPVTSGSSDESRFAHYGLGLQYYTHFTSPIRRYADVIVHRQLLASLTPVSTPSRTVTSNRPNSVPTLPPSMTPSVLDNDEDFLDDLISSVDSKLQVVEPAKPVDTALSSVVGPFPPEELVPLAGHLNKKNRNAKLASRACDELFLALYFSTHTVKAPAIITAIKANGFIVYIPLYDLRAPVYIRDKDGHVQIDPLLLGVRIVDSHPATGAFAAADCVRLVPQARIRWDANRDSDTLEVLVPESGRAGDRDDGMKVGAMFKILDELEVQVSCDLSASAARIPQLRLLLIGRAKGKREKVVTTKAMAAKRVGKSLIPEVQRVVQTKSRENEQLARQQDETRPTSPSTVPSQEGSPHNLYEAFANRGAALLRATDKRQRDKKKSLDVKRVGTSGRLVFGGFKPPPRRHYQQTLASYMDSRSAELEAELNIQRDGGDAAAWTSAEGARQIERDAMTRTLKLAAERRHDRINKRNKANK